jgi:hypothetical protein
MLGGAGSHPSTSTLTPCALGASGHDAVEARKLLAQFEDLESMHIAHRDRLAPELGVAA